MVLQTPADAQRRLEHGRSLLGPGWKEVTTLDDLDPDEYESDEEVGASTTNSAS